jgi:predicted dinucleotide-binding enzyme
MPAMDWLSRLFEMMLVGLHAHLSLRRRGAHRGADCAASGELRHFVQRLCRSAAAASAGDVIVLAVPWEAVPETLGSLDGKIIVDATNPLTRDLELALGFDDSAGETVARLAPHARVVKAFNITGSGNMADSRYGGGKLMMAIAGDEEEEYKRDHRG